MSNNAISISIQVTNSGPKTGRIEEKAATEYAWHGETKERSMHKERSLDPKDLDIPEAPACVAGAAAVVCGWALFCLPGLFSSWQRWPISRLILKVQI